MSCVAPDNACVREPSSFLHHAAGHELFQVRFDISLASRLNSISQTLGGDRASSSSLESSREYSLCVMAVLFRSGEYVRLDIPGGEHVQLQLRVADVARLVGLFRRRHDETKLVGSTCVWTLPSTLVINVPSDAAIATWNNLMTEANVLKFADLYSLRADVANERSDNPISIVPMLLPPVQPSFDRFALLDCHFGLRRCYSVCSNCHKGFCPP